MSDKIDDGLQREITSAFHDMKDNTEVHDDKKQLKVAKLNMPASIIDFIMDHYGFFDLVELNTLSLYILNMLGHMEKDGFKFGIYRQKENDSKTESYQLDFHDIIAQFRIGLADSLNKEKLAESGVEAQEKGTNEKNNM